MRRTTLHAALLSAIVCTACGSAAKDPAAPRAPDRPDTLPATFAGRLVYIMPGGWLTAMDIATGATVRLGPRGYFHHVSPDGRKLVFTTREETIGLLDLDTGKQILLQNTGVNVAPRWSPDGRRILFWSMRTGAKQLWLMNADGSSPAQLTHTSAGENLEGDWSPDGTRIAFRRCEGSGPGACNIWLIDADGTNLQRLTFAERQDQTPRWSPDGTRIAFVRLAGPPDAANWDIYVMHADGSGIVRLTTHEDDEWSPAWTPDGSRIAYFRYNAQNDMSDIFTIASDGGPPVLLIRGPEEPVYGPRRQG